MDAHDDLMAIDVDMTLHERHRLGQHIVACTDEVHAKHLVVADNAEDALVVALSLLRIELNDYSALRVRLNRPLRFREGEHIRSVIEELEGRRLVRLIDNVQQAVRRRVHLHFSELDRLAGQDDINAVRLALARQLELVAANDIDSELGISALAYNCWIKSDGYYIRPIWLDLASVLVQND